jgi:hypothetical protein
MLRCFGVPNVSLQKIDVIIRVLLMSKQSFCYTQKYPD